MKTFISLLIIFTFISCTKEKIPIDTTNLKTLAPKKLNKLNNTEILISKLRTEGVYDDNLNDKIESLDRNDLYKEIKKQFNCLKDEKECDEHLKYKTEILLGFKNKKIETAKFFIKFIDDDKSIMEKKIAVNGFYKLRLKNLDMSSALVKLLEKYNGTILASYILALIVEMNDENSIFYFKKLLKRSKDEKNKSIEEKEKYRFRVFSSTTIMTKIANRDNKYLKDPKIVDELGEIIIKHIDWDSFSQKLYGVRTLGVIGYKKATPFLLKLLKNEKDIWLMYVAMNTFAMLKSKKSISRLKEISKKFWYYPLRKVAKEMIKIIEDKNYGEYWGIISFPKDRHLTLKNMESNCKRISIKTLGEVDLIKTKYLGVKDGVLIGESRGEFIGKLFFVKNGVEKQLLRKNIISIYKLNKQIFVLTGYAHLSFNYGDIYKIIKNENNDYEVKHWQTLPKKPYSIKLIDSQHLLINNYLILDHHGNLKMLKCK